MSKQLSWEDLAFAQRQKERAHRAASRHSTPNPQASATSDPVSAPRVEAEPDEFAETAYERKKRLERVAREQAEAAQDNENAPLEDEAQFEQLVQAKDANYRIEEFTGGNGLAEEIRRDFAGKNGPMAMKKAILWHTILSRRNEH